MTVDLAIYALLLNSLKFLYKNSTFCNLLIIPAIVFHNFNSANYFPHSAIPQITNTLTWKWH